MRWLVAAVAISMTAFSTPARASDELPLAGAGMPLDAAALGLARGGTATEAGASAEALNLTATSTLEASLSQASTQVSGELRTGDITLGDVTGAMGGVTSVQLSTGFNNIQQSSAALAFAF
ncbi:MAG TPA: hypothetical protein VLV76_28820 [Candidatus Acidoferrum sp.]|nr:hypothetical protein [Candidatus Acidoferrum sp.]